ncbi:MAG: MnmA/TRMU family protein, partial [Chloroflexota bacterium]
IQRADELGIQYVATGHYARVNYDAELKEHVLRKAVDGRKDQSDMLHALRQEHLGRVLFPLGSKTKTETRQLARDFGLPVAEKPDSQEICFVAGDNYKEFLRGYIGNVDRPGDVVDREGTVLGRHNGIHEFTVGQRRGLGIAASEPRYVVELRPRENQVVIGNREDASCTALVCSKVTSTGSLKYGALDCAIKIRYRTPERAGTVHLDRDGARVAFREPVWGAAPGQLAVFYDGDRVLGGATIDRTIRAA